jgi:amino acid permease
MKKDMNQSGPAGAIYGLGFIGAVVYFIVHATSFWMGVLGFLKALVWPAFLVYGLLKFIGM